ncbi:farnesyl pyrophosphate synthase-like isoform X1 [Phragmites australis]|uniref:farnesyl pyrophosphate synthase-like isoform X1 n=1 Tax=Phragmites australis TaxID=29695 RepID=UPI002D78DBA4|nr:farnesyl pyrophosphate synthase-like isoform X1 [Phragmites australis]
MYDVLASTYVHPTHRHLIHTSLVDRITTRIEHDRRTGKEMGSLAASHVPSGLLSAGLAALANPGEVIRRASRLEDELKQLLRTHGGRAGSAAPEQGADGQRTKERFLRAYERLKSELLNDRAFGFTEEARQWVAKDDYLDCFGDPEVIGKVQKIDPSHGLTIVMLMASVRPIELIGTDIEDYKCSWLIVQAMELANENEMKILYENYGKSDPKRVAAVKNVYKELDLQDIFLEYESRVYKHLVSTIDAEPDRAIREILKSFWKKIYRRKK